MKILITGGNGQLGHDLNKRLAVLAMEHLAIDIDTCDLTNREETLSVLTAYHPDCVIHCAAYTAVEKAENNAALCERVNVEGTRNVAEACKAMDAAMVYISTDYVFSGEGSEPFETDAPKAPISVYGRTKYEGERAVQALLDKYFIVRTSWVFGVNGQNFVKTMRRLGKEKESLTVVSDQIGSPTYTVDLAELLCDMVQTDRYGVYHATNEGFCSWFAFAQRIMELEQLPCQIRPVTTREYNAAVRRPLNSRLSKKSLQAAHFRLLPPWENALARYLAELRQQAPIACIERRGTNPNG